MNEKQALAGMAVRAIARALETAPYVGTGRQPFSADDVLQSVVTADFTETVSCADGAMEQCVICCGEPHGADCPVGLLEAIHEIGINTEAKLPANLGMPSRVKPLIPLYAASENASPWLKEYERAFKAREKQGLDGDAYLAEYWRWQFYVCQEQLNQRLEVLRKLVRRNEAV